jgi:hypothetical protein
MAAAALSQIGLHNMLGTSGKWTADRYRERCYQARERLDPTGPPDGEICEPRG